jgi:hypothetical protein
LDSGLGVEQEWIQQAEPLIRKIEICDSETLDGVGDLAEERDRASPKTSVRQARYFPKRQFNASSAPF